MDFISKATRQGKRSRMIADAAVLTCKTYPGYTYQAPTISTKYFK